MRAAMLGLLCLLGSSVGLAENEPLVAVVDLKFLEETDFVTGYLCFGDSDAECSPWSNGYLFEARLRKTISGTAPGKKFLVIYGSHALGKADMNGVTGKFSKLEDGIGGAQYQLVQRAVPGRPACFNWWGRDGEGSAEQPRFGSLLQCFDPGNPVDPPSKDSPHYDPEQSLRVANEAYNQAIIAGDISALERIFAREFIYTAPDGQVRDKGAQLSLFSTGLDVESGVGADERIQVQGKAGIVTGRFDAKGSFAGRPFETTERYTSVWIIRDDRWQLLAEQGTLLARRP